MDYLNVRNAFSHSGGQQFDADEFNNFFIDGVPTGTSVKDAYKCSTLCDVEDKFVFTSVSVDDVERVLWSIKSNAVGTDKIDLKMLQLVFPNLGYIITYIINFCLTHNTFPEIWKSSKVIPIPKKNNPSNLSEFRPVSILPTFSKIVEKIISNQLKVFITANKILPVTQSGFRSGHSTTTALATVTDDLFRACDKRMYTCLILIDFSRAFDTLDHAILCSKFKCLGISDLAVGFFNRYLQNRSQCTEFNGHVSKFRSITRGVPQGSILGPLLFSIYTSDLKKQLEFCSVHQYADDTQLYYSFSQENINAACERINSDLLYLTRYVSAHSLVLNEKKTEMLIFGPKPNEVVSNPNFSVSINSTVLHTKDYCKNLGLHIDNNLKFTTHVRHLLQKAYAKLRVLYIHRKALSTEVILYLCDSLILSSLSYANVVFWPALTAREKLSIQKVQNQCIKLAYGLRKFDHFSDKLCASGWLTMNERFLVHLACLTYKINNTQIPLYLYSKLVKRSDLHGRQTRTCSLYDVPSHSTEQFKKSFSYVACATYNSLPGIVKNSATFSLFKRRVKSHIKSLR
nr:unnamed protein product [Callosobruchus chinensis]